MYYVNSIIHFLKLINFLIFFPPKTVQCIKRMRCIIYLLKLLIDLVRLIINQETVEGSQYYYCVLCRERQHVVGPGVLLAALHFCVGGRQVGGEDERRTMHRGAALQVSYLKT